MRWDTPKIWILRGIKKGILSSKYPKSPPTQSEIPPSSAPPVATPSSDWPSGEAICPTGAIRSNEKAVRLGSCIYCRRCASAGFEFPGEKERGVASMRATLDATVNADDIKSLEEKYGVFGRSLHVLMIDVGSCNACNLEVLNLTNPYYDMSRLGIFFTNSPKHADALVVVGALNRAMVDVLKRTYESMPSPKLVVSVGACALSGGVFRKTESFVSPVEEVIPVDVCVPGCPPSPLQVLEGLLLGMGRLEKGVPGTPTEGGT